MNLSGPDASVLKGYYLFNLVAIFLWGDFLFLLVLFLVECVFQGLSLFHLGHQISGHRVVHNIPLFFF